MRRPHAVAIGLSGAIFAFLAAGAPTAAQDGAAEAAMDAYVRCLDGRYTQLRSSCEPAGVVATAVFAGCAAPQQRLEQTILPFHRFFEEMKLTMAGIRAAQQERILGLLVEYRLANPCPARQP